MLARQTAPKPMTFEEYLEWEALQEEKWELIDGQPVLRSARWSYDPVTGMAGATYGHNLVIANLLGGLNRRLRPGPCRALPSDIKTRSPTGNTRYPDVTVECGSPDFSSLASAEPRVLFEVLSPSNTLKQQLKLLDDYQAVPAVAQIVWLEQDRPSALSWTREGEGWRRQELEGVEAVLELPSLDVSLPLSEVYEDFGFGTVRPQGAQE